MIFSVYICYKNFYFEKKENSIFHKFSAAKSIE